MLFPTEFKSVSFSDLTMSEKALKAVENLRNKFDCLICMLDIK